MDNKTAIFIAGLILAGVIVDQVFYSGQIHLFLAKKLGGLIDTLAVWR